MIGSGCSIMNSNFHSVRYKERMMYPDPGIENESVSIGDGVFIGMGCTILKGTTIGARSVIGAGSIVSGKIGRDEIWAGNPAAFVRKIENFNSQSFP